MGSARFATSDGGAEVVIIGGARYRQLIAAGDTPESITGDGYTFDPFPQYVTAAEALAILGEGPGASAVLSVNGLTGAVELTGDGVPDGTTRLLMLDTERAKLGTIAPYATANALDTVLKDRANHTGVQPSTSISDFTEAVQDAVAQLLAAGTGVTVAYDDAAGKLTLTSTAVGGSTDPEVVRDTIGVALSGVGLVTVTVNDAGDTITVATTATQNATDAVLKDRANHTGAQAISTVTGLQAALDAKASQSSTTTSLAGKVGTSTTGLTLDTGTSLPGTAPAGALFVVVPA